MQGHCKQKQMQEMEEERQMQQAQVCETMQENLWKVLNQISPQ